MNKKILAVAIGAAMVAPLAAQADMKISGRVAGELISQDGKIDFDDFGNSRLQFDISDESGFYARYAADIRLGRRDIGTSPNFAEDRDQYVGIKGDWGSIQAGRMAGAVKNLEGDAFIGTFLEYRNAFLKGGSYGSSSFVNQMLQYGNKFGDANLAIQYNPVDATNGANGDIGIGLKAKLAGANVFAGWNNEGNVTGGGYWKVGGDMGFGDFNVNLAYESDTTGGTDTTSWVLGGRVNMGGGMVDVSYSDKGAVATDAAYRVAYYKKQSKKAHWWVGYTSNGSGSTGNTATYGGGVRVDM